MSVVIPDKLFFKIGEVAQLIGTKTSVLRFWETEFDFLKPEKSSTGQRLYSKKEVNLIIEVKRLLYDEKFTIEGVKKRISPRGKLLVDDLPPPSVSNDHISLLREIKSELKSIRCLL
jgi:DNA-binding transcriptional MerR regulator